MKSLLPRVVIKAVSFFVLTLGLPAAWFGYLVLRTRSLEERAGSSGWRLIEVVEPPRTIDYPLPRNVSQIHELPDMKVFGRSFQDVVSRKLSSSYLASISDCKVATFYDQWSNEHSVIVDQKNELVPLRHMEVNGGKGWQVRGGHANVLRRGDAHAIAVAAWVFENWSGNYFHWLVYHLPKLLLLRQKCPRCPLILPEKNVIYPTITRSLEILGFTESLLVRQTSAILEVKELSFVEADRHDPHLLRQVAAVFSVKQQAPATRFLYISRKAAQWRRVTNEPAIEALLEQRGFDVIQTELLSFDEQIAMMSAAKVVVSPHGAGLANMLFMPQGAHVVELVNPEFPNSDYYSLANALGHSYWLYSARCVRDVRPVAYQDLYVPIDTFTSLIDDVLSFAQGAKSSARTGG